MLPFLGSRKSVHRTTHYIYTCIHILFSILRFYIRKRKTGSNIISVPIIKTRSCSCRFRVYVNIHEYGVNPVLMSRRTMHIIKYPCSQEQKNKKKGSIALLTSTMSKPSLLVFEHQVILIRIYSDRNTIYISKLFVCSTQRPRTLKYRERPKKRERKKENSDITYEYTYREYHENSHPYWGVYMKGMRIY